MNEFFKLWRLEFLRDRSIFYVLLPLEILLLFLIGYGVFGKMVTGFLLGMMPISLIIAGCFISTGGLVKDFQQETIRLFFALPMKFSTLFLGKYLYSLFLFLLISSVALIFLWMMPLPESHFQKQVFILVKYGSIFLLLMLHAMFFYWTVLLRSSSGPALAVLMIPVALGIFYPVFTIVSFNGYDVGTYVFYGGLLSSLVFLIFLSGAYVLWMRSVVVNESQWRIFWKQAVVFFLLPCLIWIVCRIF